MITGEHDGRRYTFLHIPKTGGRFVAELLNRCFNGEVVRARMHSYQIPLANPGLVFTLVRHPLVIYRSWWGHVRNKNKVDLGWPIEEFALLPAEEFVRKTVEKHPGYLGKLYKRYTEKCDHVGITESIPTTLDHVLQIGGKHEIENLMGSCGLAFCNVTGSQPWSVSKELCQRLLEVESEALDIWTDAARGESV